MMLAGPGVRLFALLSLRGRLHLTITTGLPWRIPASRILRASFPDRTDIPRRRDAQLAWLEDRIEEEFGPLHARYTPRKEAPSA